MSYNRISKINQITCPVCDKFLKFESGNNKYQIASCGKHNYPFIFGVLYLNNDSAAKRTNEAILRGNKIKAQMYLLNLRRRLLIPSVVLLNMPLRIPFVLFVGILRFFGYDKNWCNYLLTRKSKNSYKLTKSITKYFNKGDRIVDMGSGVGQILPLIGHKIGYKNLVAIDDFFLNLMIARKYFTDSRTTLICMDMVSQDPLFVRKSEPLHQGSWFRRVRWRA